MWEQETSKIEEQQAKINEVNSEVSESLNLSKLEQAIQDTDADLDLDFENAKLSDAKQKSEALNANIANMISALDETTILIGEDFSGMRTKSGMEKLVGFFSPKTSEEMRTKRISESNISDKLNDLIVQSEGVLTILQKQETYLHSELEIGEANISSVLKMRQEVVDKLQDVKAQMNELDPVIMELEAKVDAETDVSTRTKLEDELAQKNKDLQNLKNQEAIELSKSQSLEKYIEHNKTNIKSLGEQKTAQQVLIEKLKLDTAQRVILFKQYEVSLKTAQQQETAHQIVNLGSKVDKATMVGMAQIGSAASNSLIEMLETHTGDMKDAEKIAERQKTANERFARRFSIQKEKHDTRNY